MDSELQRLRFRVRQLEREVRALRTATGDVSGEEPRGRVKLPDPVVFRRRVLRDPRSRLEATAD